MSHDLYIVAGVCGQYSDRSEWPVCWFSTEEAAKMHAARLQAASDAEDSDDLSDWVGGRREAVKARMAAAGDPEWHSDYTGTRYYVYSVPAGPGES